MRMMEQILADLPRLRATAAGLRDLFLSDIVLIGEIPAPTDGESARAGFVADRLVAAGLHACSIDEKGNAVGLLPGETGRKTLLLAAPLDTFVTEAGDQSIELGADRLVGPFVGDNCIALAALTILPSLLDRLQVRLNSHVVLVACAKSLGRGNLDGLRHFLASSRTAPAAGICLEGVQLGRLNYAAAGVFRGEIHCRLPDNYNWAQYGATGTIVPMSEVIGRISRIPIPQKPLTTIVLGSIQGGLSYSNIARETVLQFEVRSESLDELKAVREKLEDIVEEVSSQSGKQVVLDAVAWRGPGGIDIAHPMVRNARAILGALGVQPALYPTTSQLAALLEQGIPGVTLGITTGERRNELDEIDEAVAVDPMFTGLAQIVANLMAMDE
jgi:acetylornithine deacetylase/succinyl-diaminopimelate desuccinylase-like protein